MDPRPPTGDELDRALRALPSGSPSGPTTATIHHRARELFERQARRETEGWLAILDSVYSQVEPVLAVGVGLAYLGWTTETVAALLR